MKKDWKYILYLSLAIGLFLLVKLSGPKQYNWYPTYEEKDKNPFGAFVLKELLPDIFPGKRIEVSNKTFYELKDSVRSDENLIILTHRFTCEKADALALLKHVENGATIFIASQSFSGPLSDTLKLHTEDYFFRSGLASELRLDTSYVRFLNVKLNTRFFHFKRDNIPNYFDRFDSTRTAVIAENQFNQPVSIRMHWGKGNFILNCTPLAFTNIYALTGENDEFVASSLSYLPVTNTHWTEYYSVGRMEAGTPLRFILTHEPLAWAYFIAVISLLLFMVFESKRKQRIIPIIQPLQNTSLEFVSTIGNLYYQRNDHKNIAEKKILFFFEHIRTRYQVSPAAQDENFVITLAKKSGNGEHQVRTLLQLIAQIRSRVTITTEDLIELNQLIEKFNSAKS